MKKTIAALVISMFFGLSNYAQQIAFPTAEGWGKYTVGGRGGEVIEVTNLNDNGPGSLRAAVEASGPRTVVFRVSGTIELESDLSIRNPYITIAGQTAPGEGICIRKYPIMIRADEIILRYLRVRLGDESGNDTDAISGRYFKNIIVDHVSASWSVDETVSIYHCNNITVQWCLISESMYNSNHVKGHHGFGGIWGGPNSTYHHNLIAHHSSRNPRFASGSGNTDFRNNVIYNWGYQSVYGGEKVQNETYNYSSINMVANYYKPGPGTLSGALKYRIVEPSSRNDPSDNGEWYVADNYVFGNPTVTADNWNGGVQSTKYIKLTEPAQFIPINQQTAEDAYQSVLADVGASLPRRDTIDNRIIHEVTTGTATYGTGSYNVDNGLGSKVTGIIDTQRDVGGWPELKSGPALDDRDHDGMPDSWELDQGLDPDDPEDRNLIGEGGYTNLENYLNGIAEFPAFLIAPSNIAAKLIDFTKVEVSWEDNTENETGFRLERAEGDTGKFVSIAEVEADVTVYSDSLLNELTLYRYRVMAFNDSLESVFEGVAEITTLSPTSPPLPVSDPNPADNADYVATSPTLEWKASINAESYDIYFGAVNPPPLVVNQVEITFAPGELDNGKTYYWRIDGKNTNGTTVGSIWNFTVKPAIVPQQIAYWKFDEKAGAIASDAGDNSLDGVLTNMSLSSWTTGILNGALRFKGSDNYVLVSHDDALDFKDESFSISAWLKAEPLTGNSMFLIHKGSFSSDAIAGTNGKWYGIEIKNNELRFAIDDNVVKTQVLLSNASDLLSEKWAHISGVRDTETGLLKLYLNGEMVASTTDGTGSISQDVDLYLGSNSDPSGALLGILDEVKMFNYALSDAEILDIYESLSGVGIEEGLSHDAQSVRVYPNPFSTSATIQYQLKSESEVRLCIYNVLGREVKMIVNQQQTAGAYSFTFDASDLAKGVYIYSLKIGLFEQRGKLMRSE